MPIRTDATNCATLIEKELSQHCAVVSCKHRNSTVLFAARFVLVLCDDRWQWLLGGAAKRRRERRLRSWWRHERMSVAAALAETTHHSFPKGGWSEAYKAQLGPKTASAQVEPASFQSCSPRLCFRTEFNSSAWSCEFNSSWWSRSSRQEGLGPPKEDAGAQQQGMTPIISCTTGCFSISLENKPNQTRNGRFF